MGIPCIGLNGGTAFKHSEAFSFQVATDTQEETDRYWDAIVGKGSGESQCGWCRDRWGISWQITLRVLTDAMATGGYLIVDCSPETPKGRVSVCYDREGLESRKEHRPATTAMDQAVEIGIGLLTEEAYVALQKLDEFDKKTSSWVKTPADIRKPGGALYCERCYSGIFTGHNGAQSCYAVRGFRGSLRV